MGYKHLPADLLYKRRDSQTWDEEGEGWDCVGSDQLCPDSEISWNAENTVSCAADSHLTRLECVCRPAVVLTPKGIVYQKVRISGLEQATPKGSLSTIPTSFFLVCFLEQTLKCQSNPSLPQPHILLTTLICLILLRLYS